MDSELIRTFLEVHRTRHFARAADRLHVTPAAVSARVRLLEEQLGARLFVRSRNNVRLTAAGQRLLPHAETILRSLNRAVLSVGAGESDQESVALGSLHSIWRVLLPGWLPALYQPPATPLLQLELLTTPVLVDRVREQSLDLALVYEPPQVTDLIAEQVGVVLLELMATRGKTDLSHLDDYVHVDWGTTFSLQLARELPDLPEPVLRVDAPEVALEFLLRRGGAAYLPAAPASPALDTRRLSTVRGAPVVKRPVYLISSTRAPESAARQAVIESLRDWMDKPVSVS